MEAIQDIFSLPSHSRVWVYQSDRVLTTSETEKLEAWLSQFIGQWQAHGKDLMAEARVLLGRFVVFALDEQVAGATGCSIDKQVHLMKELGSQLEIDWFNRMLVVFEKDGSLDQIHMNEFQEMLKSGEVTSQTPVFNNLVSTLAEFQTHWKTSVDNSWHKQLV